MISVFEQLTKMISTFLSKGLKNHKFKEKKGKGKKSLVKSTSLTTKEADVSQAFFDNKKQDDMSDDDDDSVKKTNQQKHALT